MKFWFYQHLSGRWRRSMTLLWIFFVIGALGSVWLCVFGEAFFSITRPLRADVLIVDDWIGLEGLHAASEEFGRGGYTYLVVAGGPSEDLLVTDVLRYGESVKEELTRSGVPDSRIIVSSVGEVDRERTFKSALAAWQSIQRAGIRPSGINLFTLGPHAMRSHLIYQKVCVPGVKVGVIAFTPSEYRLKPWWLSSKRANCLLKEIIGYPFELLFNSGRPLNSPIDAMP